MNDEDLPTLWRALSPRQRTAIAEDVHPHPNSWRRKSPGVNTTRVLIARGLLNYGQTTHRAKRLVDWAIEHSRLTRGPDGEWCNATPLPTKQRVADLASQGLTVSQIAQEIGRTRQAVDACCKRYGIQAAPARRGAETLTKLRAEIVALRARIAELEGDLTRPT